MAMIGHPLDLILNRAQGDALQAPSAPSTPPGREPKRKEPDGYVSTLFQCQTAEASMLCIYDAIQKLNSCNDGGIGGTYSGEEPELWFYFTTSKCHGNNHLLNLFINQRNPGAFSVQVSDSDELTQKQVLDDDGPHIVLPRIMSTRHTFRSTKANQNHYLKTFCFNRELALFNQTSTLLIPIKIEMNPKFALNENVVKSIKLQHDLSGLLTKQEKTDIILVSSTNKEFPSQKILLAAHSPVLRNMMKNSEHLTQNSKMNIDITDNDMDLLLEFIYTGTIVNVKKQDCLKLLVIADKFHLPQLFMLAQHTICDQITVSNAVEVAVIAKKYNLEELQIKVFNFIIKNPEVMKTDAWMNLKDVELTKFLFQYMHTMRE